MNESVIFTEALRQATAAERSAYLDRACAGNPRLRSAVEALLAANASDPNFLEQPPASLGGTVDAPRAATDPAPEVSEQPGYVLADRYKLLEPIGEGGMGTVWMAQQTEPVRRYVAVKLIKAGMDSKQVMGRFEAERQALALMDHPNIAKVFDGGVTKGEPGRVSAGRPFFVMELVKGVPITRYCDEHHLTPRQRLELFVPVCHAIQHAHQKGVIHRDLKPSNVLVAQYDERPVPKVIDFGVAKATGQQLTEQTLHTGFGAVVGTVEYMSPEQASFNQLDVDTRSDIYSLGVLLYELLAGSPPFSKKELESAGMLEMLRVIREQEPSKPSTKLSTADALPTLAANRGTEPAKLTRLVRGELDWIVMKSLDKDRGRRYETANGLAMDVQRFLADEPVQACPPSAVYRFRKMVHRNKRAVAVAAAILVLVLAGAAISTWQAIRATIAERDTREALGQVTAEQAKTQQALTAARDALDVLTDDVVETMFARQPELGETEKAFLRKVLKHHEAIAAQEAETAAAQFLRAKGQYKVAHLRELLGEPAAAIAGYQQAALLLKGLADQVPDEAEYRHKLARANGNLGILLADAGKEAESETAFRLALDLRTKLADAFPKKHAYRQELATNYNDLAHLMERQGKFPEADKAYRDALALLEKLVAEAGEVPAHHQDLARVRSNLGQWLRTQQKYTEAEKLYRDAIKVQEEQVDKFPTVPRRRRQLADSYQGFGILLAEQGNEDDSEKTFEKAIAVRKTLVDTFPGVRVYRRELAATYHDLGYLQTRRKKLADAEKSFQRAVELTEKLLAEGGALPDYRKFLSQALTNLGKLLQDQNKDAEAEKAYRDSLKLDVELAKEFPSAPQHHGGAANVLMMLGQIQHGRKDFKAAVPLLTDARTQLQAVLDINPKSPMGRKFYRDNLRLLAKSYFSLADHAKLAATADDLASFRYEPPGDFFDAATMLSSAVTLVQKDMELDAAKRKELADTYTERALAQLRQAIARDFRDTERMQKDPRLEPLRERPEFKKLLTELQAKGK